MLYFELLFDKNRRVVSTPETKKNVNTFKWINFNQTAYRFVMRSSGIYTEVTESFARKMIGDEAVETYIQFCDSLAVKYLLEEVEEEQHCGFYTSYMTASENFTQGFHLSLSNGRVGNNTWLMESDDSVYDNIHKMLEM